MDIGGHEENIQLFVTTLGHYPIVLGIPWLHRHDVKTDWKAHSITFNSSFCLEKCMDHHSPVTRSSITSAIPQRPTVLALNTIEFYNLAEDEDLQIYEVEVSTIGECQVAPVMKALVPQ